MEVLGEDSGSGGGPDLTSYVKQARRGFRSDVVQLLSALEQADLLIPLRESLPGATDGERTKIDGELRVIPHFLPAPEGAELCALFTRAELLDAIATELGWQTAGGELQFCSVPGGVALEMANSSIDGEQVRGLVIDAASESELMLTPAEVRSLVRGQAIPLVGYVQAIPDDDQRTLVAESGEPLPPALLAELVNAERDLEPHLTLKLTPRSAKIEHQAVANRVFEAIGPHLPPPGYVDIVFAEPASKAGRKRSP